MLVAKRSDLHYVHVKFDGVKFSVPCHPTDGVEYLVTNQEGS